MRRWSDESSSICGSPPSAPSWRAVLRLPPVSCEGNCRVADQPAATLLFPYFEVDLARPRRRQTTLISINNASLQLDPRPRGAVDRLGRADARLRRLPDRLRRPEPQPARPPPRPALPATGRTPATRARCRTTTPRSPAATATAEAVTALGQAELGLAPGRPHRPAASGAPLPRSASAAARPGSDDRHRLRHRRRR